MAEHERENKDFTVRSHRGILFTYNTGIGKVISLFPTLKYAFIGDKINYNQLIHHVDQNAAMNYTKYLKEVIDRAVVQDWMTTNLFKLSPVHMYLPKRNISPWSNFSV
jgi:hypothetical protein